MNPCIQRSHEMVDDDEIYEDNDVPTYDVHMTDDRIATSGDAKAEFIVASGERRVVMSRMLCVRHALS